MRETSVGAEGRGGGSAADVPADADVQADDADVPSDADVPPAAGGASAARVARDGRVTAREAQADPEVTEREVERLLETVDALRGEIARRIVGQEAAVEEVTLCLLAGGHGLLEGVPGLAKTLLVRTLAEALDLEFRRVQFTPDLMPGDITGTEVIEEDRSTGRRASRFLRGPVFTQVLLADEINRAPPKTQSALLEAMQEGRVTVAGEDLLLPVPFLVLATQNPIEQEGTYPLPEAQLDRFMLKIRIPYPDEPDEVRILRATTGREAEAPRPVLDAEGVLRLRRLVRGVVISDTLLEWVARLVRGTRPEAGSPGSRGDRTAGEGRPSGERGGGAARGEALDDVTRWVRWGAGPRAGQFLVLGAKAHALLRGRLHVAPSDIERMALPVLRHRILLNFRAEAEGLTPDELVRRLLRLLPPPASGLP